MAKSKRTTRKRGVRKEFEIIERKICDAQQLNLSRFHPRQAAEHFIPAGRMWKIDRELYEFYAYCRFPYNVYENQ